MNTQPIRTRLLGVILATLLASGCAESPPTGPTEEVLVPTPPVSSNRGQPGKELPFRLTGTAVLGGQDFAPGFGPPTFGRSEFGGRCSVPSDFVIRFSLEGQATYLGSFTATAEHCTQVDFQAGLSSWRDGVMILTAANDDELWASYGSAGTFPPGVQFEEHHMFTGGTGRFAGAAGGGIARGSCDRAAGTCVFGLEGVIVYDASDRR